MDRRIPSLDGARAVSILLVILWHAALQFPPLPVIWRVEYGKLGVRIFFVISGFLITSLLLRELERNGRIDVGAFYLRRFFRIAPAYYVFLATMALLIPTGWVPHHYSDFPSAIFYYANYAFPHTIAHTWSLAVEEQFYLLWPGALVLLGLRRSLLGCVLLLLTAPMFRILAALDLWPTLPDVAFETVCDALATGCVLAIRRNELWQVAPYRAIVSSRYVLAIPAATLLLLAILPNSILMRALGFSVLNFGLAMTLDRYMRFPLTTIGKVMNFAPVAWVGTISYSLYLWQQPFIFNTLHLPWVVIIGGAFTCAAASYYLVERPALALRSKLCSRTQADRNAHIQARATHAE